MDSLSGLAYVNTFTFDNFFYFDRQPRDENWYAYTHPQREPFLHGRFSVEQCRFTSHSENLGNFDDYQINAIEKLLAEHRDEMNLEQFEMHKNRPEHYQSLQKETSEFKELYLRMRDGKWDPKFAFVFDSFASAEPAYRLNREFVNRVMAESNRVAESDWLEYFREDCQDTWTYDAGPTDECPTFDDFFQFMTDQLYVPMATKKRWHNVLELYAIDGVSRLYLACHDKETYFYYRDTGEAVVPVFLPPHSGWMPQYIL